MVFLRSTAVTMHRAVASEEERQALTYTEGLGRAVANCSMKHFSYLFLAIALLRN